MGTATAAPFSQGLSLFVQLLPTAPHYPQRRQARAEQRNRHRLRRRRRRRDDLRREEGGGYADARIGAAHLIQAESLVGRQRRRPREIASRGKGAEHDEAQRMSCCVETRRSKKAAGGEAADGRAAEIERGNRR